MAATAGPGYKQISYSATFPSGATSMNIYIAGSPEGANSYLLKSVDINGDPSGMAVGLDTNRTYYLYAIASAGTRLKTSTSMSATTLDINAPKMLISPASVPKEVNYFTNVPQGGDLTTAYISGLNGINSFQLEVFGQNDNPSGTTTQLADNQIYEFYAITVSGTRSKKSEIVRLSTYADQNAGATWCNTKVGAPVNVMNGNMYLQQSDYNLPGIGESVGIFRTYNSMLQFSGIFGYGWATQYDENIIAINDYSLRLALPDGRAVYFGRTETTAPFTPATPGFYGQVVKNTDITYTLTFKDGRVHQFNANGKLLSQKDRNNNQTTLTYNNFGRQVTAISDAFGRNLTLTPNANGTIQQISDSIGVVATYEYYPSTTLLKTVTYNDGSKYKFEYTTINGNTYLATVKDALDNILETHLYDSAGRATTSEKQGGVEKYTLDYTNPAYTQVTDILGRITKYYFDPGSGRNVVKKIEGNCNCGSAGQTITYEYDSKLNRTKQTDALRRETTYTYDPNGNRLTQTEKVGTTDLGTDTFTYNSFGQVLTWTDKLGGVTTNTYDANGNLKTTTDALGKVTTIEYPAANNKGLPDSIKDARNNLTKFKWFPASGLLQEVEDANLKKTTFTYDARGRTKTVTNALGYVTSYNYYDDAQRKVEMIYPNADKITYKYDVRRLLESMTDERGKVTSYTFDNAYRLTKITDPLLHIKDYDYDLMSNLKLTKDGLGNQTDYAYDDFNRLREIKYPLAEATATARLTETFTYDPTGRIKQVTDTVGRNTVYDYYDAERRNTVTNTDGEVTTTRYNARNQMTQVTDAKNQVYDFTYDPLGRMLTQTRAGGTMTYIYDAVGNREKRIDYLGRETGYEYDNFNRLKKINYLQAINTVPVPTPIQTAVYTYDELSRLKMATNDAGTVSFNYDSRNRLESEIDVFGHTIAREYELTATVNQKRLKFDGRCMPNTISTMPTV